MVVIDGIELSDITDTYIPPINDKLKQAVTEYYEWNGDRNAKPIKFIVNKMPGKYKMLLVRFIDAKNVKMSALMDYRTWADGHWDVTEIDVVQRACEKCMVSEFENSENFL